MHKHYIYRILNAKNDKTYIGVSISPAKQVKNHLSGSGSRLIFEDAKRDGKEVFVHQVLEEFSDNDAARKKMQSYIIRHNSLYPAGYNLAIGGRGSRGCVWDGASRAKITGYRSHRSRLTEAQVIKIYWDNRVRREIAEEYGISTTMVTKIKRGQAWSHVSERFKDLKS